MPYPSVLPGRTFRAPQPYSSRLLFDWVAADLSLVARTGQTGAFTRTSTQAGLILDVNGRPLNAPPNMPRFGTFSGLTGLLFEPGKSQLIENADCEADIVGWGANNASTLLRDNVVAFGGQWSCKITVANTPNSGVGLLTRAGARFAAVAGTGYTFSCWVYASGSAVGKNMILEVQWWNVTPAVISTSVSGNFPLVAGWQRLTFTAIAPVNTVTVWPFLDCGAAQGIFTVWADDPQLEAIQASTAPFYATAATQSLTAAVNTLDDSLIFPFPSVLGPMWAYAKYVDLGLGTGGGGGASRVFQLGATFQGGWLLLDGGGVNGIQGYYEPPGGASSSFVAYAYVVGNIVEAVVQVLNDGSCRTVAAVNGGNDVLGANGGVPTGGVLPFGNPGTGFVPAQLRFASGGSQFQPFAMVRCKVGGGLLPGIGAAGAGLKVALARAA